MQRKCISLRKRGGTYRLGFIENDLLYDAYQRIEDDVWIIDIHCNLFIYLYENKNYHKSRASLIYLLICSSFSPYFIVISTYFRAIVVLLFFCFCFTLQISAVQKVIHLLKCLHFISLINAFGYFFILLLCIYIKILLVFLLL